MDDDILILWSGGLDSTYSIWHYLKNTDAKITALKVKLNNNILQTKAESLAIEKMLSILKDWFPGRINMVYSECEFKIYDNINLPQAIIWPLFGLFASNIKTDKMVVSYVMNDDAISYLNDIRSLYESYRPFVEHLPELVFWEKTHKKEFYNHLPNPLLEHVWVCENPKLVNEIDKKLTDIDISEIIHCHECLSCKRYFELK